MKRTALQAAAIGIAFASITAQAAPAADKLYLDNCAACHGGKMEGILGPALTDHAWTIGTPSKANLVKVISEGVPGTDMPAWKQTLNGEQIGALADYIVAANSSGKKPTTATPAAAAKPAAAPAAPKASSGSALLSGFKLPKGFRISVYADGAATARSMAVSSNGVVYLGSRKAGKIYALVPRADKQSADVVTVAEGLDSPIGVTLLNGALYVGEISRVIRFDNIDQRYAKKPSYEVVKVDLPKDKWHGEKMIRSGPDGKLYIPVGAPCNICDTDDTKSAKLYRMNADGSQLEEVARGIRNTVGYDFHPTTKQLWFTDNGRDELGDNTPSCELNVITKPRQHFGFPYCHGGVVPDPEFGKGRTCEEFEPPAAKLGPHVAPLGMTFYTGTQFPQQTYRNNIFVAEHGSWNRENKIGYTVHLITLNNSKVVSDTAFIDGFLRGDEVVGRPVDVVQLADGSLLVSDDYGGRIFRVSYEGK